MEPVDEAPTPRSLRWLPWVTGALGLGALALAGLAFRLEDAHRLIQQDLAVVRSELRGLEKERDRVASDAVRREAQLRNQVVQLQLLVQNLYAEKRETPPRFPVPPPLEGTTGPISPLPIVVSPDGIPSGMSLEPLPPAEVPSPPRPFRPVEIPGWVGDLRAATVPSGGPLPSFPSNVALEEPPRELRWSGALGAYFSLTLVDAEGRVLEQSNPLQGDRWRFDERLAPGATYRWRIAAIVQGREGASTQLGPMSEAVFRVLSAAELARVRNARRANRGPIELARAFAESGLLPEAEAQLRIAPPGPETEGLKVQIRSARGG